MMRRSTLKAQLVAAAAALGLGGCGHDAEPAQIVADPSAGSLPAGEDVREESAEEAPARPALAPEPVATPELQAADRAAESDDSITPSRRTPMRRGLTPAISGGRSGARGGGARSEEDSEAGPGPQVVCGASCGASCGGEPEDEN